jgi:hypothetical protein
MERANSLSQSLKLKHSEIKRMNSEYMNKPGVVGSVKSTSILAAQSPSNRGGLRKVNEIGALGFTSSAGGALSNQ